MTDKCEHCNIGALEADLKNMLKSIERAEMNANLERERHDKIHEDLFQKWDEMIKILNEQSKVVAVQQTKQESSSEALLLLHKDHESFKKNAKNGLIGLLFTILISIGSGVASMINLK